MLQRLPFSDLDLLCCSSNLDYWTSDDSKVSISKVPLYQWEFVLFLPLPHAEWNIVRLHSSLYTQHHLVWRTVVTCLHTENRLITYGCIWSPWRIAFLNFPWNNLFTLYAFSPGPMYIYSQNLLDIQKQQQKNKVTCKAHYVPVNYNFLVMAYSHWLPVVLDIQSIDVIIWMHFYQLNAQWYTL